MGKKTLKVHKVNFQDDEINFRWYLVRTNHNWERKAAEQIRKRFESMQAMEYFKEIFVPIQEWEEDSLTPTGKKRKAKKSYNPLESGYIYIHMIMNNHTWNIVRQTSGVSGWLTRDGRPSPQPEEDVIGLKKMLGMLDEEEEVKSSFEGEIGDRLKVKDHIFSGIEATIVEILKDKKVIKAVLENGTKMELEFHQVELV